MVALFLALLFLVLLLGGICLGAAGVVLLIEEGDLMGVLAVAAGLLMICLSFVPFNAADARENGARERAANECEANGGRAEFAGRYGELVCIRP